MSARGAGWTPPGLRCTICATRDFHAVWHVGGPPIAVCAQCAVEVLPALVADASHAAGSDPQHTADRMVQRFWRARALAAEGALRARPHPLGDDL